MCNNKENNEIKNYICDTPKTVLDLGFIWEFTIINFILFS